MYSKTGDIKAFMVFRTKRLKEGTTKSKTRKVTGTVTQGEKYAH
jgi:hypothetical protein